MVETLEQTEATPATYPNPDGEHLWARIEAYTAKRWTPRTVTWIINGPGEWKPPLGPATIDQAYRWAGKDWEEITLSPAPVGFVVPAGRHKVVATVGMGNAAPPAVMEAFKRLKDYATVEAGGLPGVSSHSINLGQVTESISRNPNFMARAIDNSGAGDLLRPYRRA